MTTTFRPGALTDSRAIFEVFTRSLGDYCARIGMPPSDNVWADPEFVAEAWERRQSLFEHLARTAEHFWVAENDERVVGYARSTLNDGVRELTEFFVLPGHQSGGVGRDLFARVFPANGAQRKLILATTDIRAQARYLKGGVYPRFTIQYLYRTPEKVTVETDLTCQPATATPSTIPALGKIDQTLFGFRRNVDHQFLLDDRQGYLWHRGGQIVGYSYLGKGAGPMALLNDADFPAVLAHAESDSAAKGESHFGMELPMINQAAVRYLLDRGYQIDSFVVLAMSDEPFGKFENYVCTSPPFFM
ncbi:MAG: GNAT family N-acetyltransferase [Anaerolineales bacterium]